MNVYDSKRCVESFLLSFFNQILVRVIIPRFNLLNHTLVSIVRLIDVAIFQNTHSPKTWLQSNEIMGCRIRNKNPHKRGFHFCSFSKTTLIKPCGIVMKNEKFRYSLFNYPGSEIGQKILRLIRKRKKF